MGRFNGNKDGCFGAVFLVVVRGLASFGRKIGARSTQIRIAHTQFRSSMDGFVFDKAKVRASFLCKMALRGTLRKLRDRTYRIEGFILFFGLHTLRISIL